MPPKPVRSRRIAVVGSRAVGKSSMIVRFVEEHFVDSYYPTIESEFTKTIRFRGKDYDVDILDTAGQDEFSIVNQKHIIGIHGYILAYSVTSSASFEMLRVVRDKILTFTGTETIPTVIVGTKNDLHMQRQVSYEEGSALASEFQCGFVETSARNDENINKAFELLIAEIEKVENPAEAASSCVIL